MLPSWSLLFAITSCCRTPQHGATSMTPRPHAPSLGLSAVLVRRWSYCTHSHVRMRGPPDWRLVRDDLHGALEGSLPLEDRLAAREQAYARHHVTAPPAVFVLNDASESATVVEVRAHDAAGLLHRIDRALESCGLDVRSA